MYSKRVFVHFVVKNTLKMFCVRKQTLRTSARFQKEKKQEEKIVPKQNKQPLPVKKVLEMRGYVFEPEPPEGQQVLSVGDLTPIQT